MDGDGDQDIVTGQAWYENVDGEGLTWKRHKNIAGANRIWGKFTIYIGNIVKS